MSNELFPDSYLLTYLNDVKTLVETNPIFSNYNTTDPWKITLRPSLDVVIKKLSPILSPTSDYAAPASDATRSVNKDKDYYDSITQVMWNLHDLFHLATNSETLTLYANVYAVLYFYCYCSNNCCIVLLPSNNLCLTLEDSYFNLINKAPFEIKMCDSNNISINKLSSDLSKYSNNGDFIRRNTIPSESFGMDIDDNHHYYNSKEYNILIHDDPNTKQRGAAPPGLTGYGVRLATSGIATKPSEEGGV